MNKCGICKKPIPEGHDCGGDCLECMATIIEDPDCITSWENHLAEEKLRKEELYKRADEATRKALEIESKLKKIYFDLGTVKVLNNDLACAVRYRLLSWRRYVGDNRLLYVEGAPGELVRIEKPLLECSAEIRSYALDHLDDFFKQCIDEQRENNRRNV